MERNEQKTLPKTEREKSPDPPTKKMKHVDQPVYRGEIKVIFAGRREVLTAEGSSGEGNKIFKRKRGHQSLPGPPSDALIIRMGVEDFLLHRVLVDTGSSINLLTMRAFKDMGFDSTQLTPVNFPLIGLSQHEVTAEGSIFLHVTASDYTKKRTVIADFIVVDIQLAYNAIMGRPLLHSLDATVLIKKLQLNIPDDNHTIKVTGDRNEAIEVHMAAVGQIEALVVDALETPDELRGFYPETMEELKGVIIGSGHSLSRGTLIPKEIKEAIDNVLKAHTDVFAWDSKDIKGISPKIANHKLNVDPKATIGKQKRRNQSREKEIAIQTEVDKLLASGFIREAKYPTWIANVVLVKKANGKYRMCVDFTNLNKACPKDCYPLPNIDQIVDSWSSSAFISGCRAGYHQIPMFEEDQEKTAFITNSGVYCYTVMSFGLKNAGATYQRLVNEMFEHQIGKTVQVYVDDMVVKSKKLEDHPRDLAEALSIFRTFGMKLNPEKCMFGVRQTKFLGYVISEQGIEPTQTKSKPFY